VVSNSAAAARAEFAARACLDSPGELDEATRLLCELATAPDPELARGGVDGIFRHAVETMGDAFEPALCDRYIEFFTRVVDYCRRLPQGAALDAELRRFGLLRRDEIVERARRVRRVRAAPASLRPRKIVVLSRVTLGADVTVTSVVLAHLLRRFPEARLTLVAPRKSAQLFAGESRVATRVLEYPRGGGLLQRLEGWLAAERAVCAEVAGLGPGEWIVVDPDSRFTQLGLLPVTVDESQYYFFESRSYARPGRATLGSLTAAWLEEVFGPVEPAPEPWIRLPPTKARREGRWASLNFGVGDNPRKRVADPFEEELLLGLLERGWRVFLDQGDGDEELARSGRLLDALGARGWRLGSDVVSWQGSIAGFAALIAASDLYIGYDSACQHIAAALAVKTVDIFAGFRSRRMVERWRPAGRGEVRMVVVEPDRPPDCGRLLAQVLEAAG